MKGQKAKRKQVGYIGKSKRCKMTSWKKRYLFQTFLRFPHLAEQIFEELDNKSLTNSRVVGASWHNFIDARDYPWKRFQEVINDIPKTLPWIVPCINKVMP